MHFGIWFRSPSCTTFVGPRTKPRRRLWDEAKNMMRYSYKLQSGWLMAKGWQYFFPKEGIFPWRKRNRIHLIRIDMSGVGDCQVVPSAKLPELIRYQLDLNVRTRVSLVNQMQHVENYRELLANQVTFPLLDCGAGLRFAIATVLTNGFSIDSDLEIFYVATIVSQPRCCTAGTAACGKKTSVAWKQVTGA